MLLQQKSEMYNPPVNGLIRYGAAVLFAVVRKNAGDTRPGYDTVVADTVCARKNALAVVQQILPGREKLAESDK